VRTTTEGTLFEVRRASYTFTLRSAEHNFSYQGHLSPSSSLLRETCFIDKHYKIDNLRFVTLTTCTAKYLDAH